MKWSRSFLLTALVVLNTGCDGEKEVPGPVPIETREVERSPVERPSALGVPPGLERFSVSRGFLHPNGVLSQSKEDGWLPRVFVHLDVIRDLFPWPIRKFEFRWGGPDSARRFGGLWHVKPLSEKGPVLSHDFSMELSPGDIPAFLRNPLLQMTIQVDVMKVLGNAEDYVTFQWVDLVPGKEVRVELSPGEILTLKAVRIKPVDPEFPPPWQVSGVLSPGDPGRSFLGAHQGGGGHGWMLPTPGETPVVLLKPGFRVFFANFHRRDRRSFLYSITPEEPTSDTLRFGVHAALLPEKIVLTDFPTGW
jgi:hypothetical protein